MNSLERVAAYAKRWDVEISHENNRSRISDYSPGPGRVDLSGWRSGEPTLHYFKHLGSTEWPYLLHDLGHSVDRIDPNMVKNELTYLTGFEVLSVKHLRLSMREWEAWHCSYYLGIKIGGIMRGEWHTAPAWWRRRRIERSCAQATKRGWFKDGKPTYVGG